MSVSGSAISQPFALPSGGTIGNPVNLYVAAGDANPGLTLSGGTSKFGASGGLLQLGRGGANPLGYEISSAYSNILGIIPMVTNGYCDLDLQPNGTSNRCVIEIARTNNGTGSEELYIGSDIGPLLATTGNSAEFGIYEYNGSTPGTFRPFRIGFITKGAPNTASVALEFGIGSTVTKFANIATAGLGIPGIYASYSSTANPGAVTNAINYTPPAVAGRYRVSWTVDQTATTTANFTVVLTWKDASGNARSQNLGGFNDAGTALTAGAITNLLGTGNYYGTTMFQIDNSATAITLSTVGTFTTVTYDFAAVLEQLA